MGHLPHKHDQHLDSGHSVLTIVLVRGVVISSKLESGRTALRASMYRDWQHRPGNTLRGKYPLDSCCGPRSA
jgi:hypothetical protein